MRIEVVLVGDELVQGRRHDANGPWLAARLEALGARVQGVRLVGDAEPEVARALQEAAAESDVVVVSGGLGPTADDLTRTGLAAAAGTDLVEDATAVRHLTEALARQGRTLDPARRRQALVPRGGLALENPSGTAPGIRMDVRGAVVIALPGVPRELKAMFALHVEPLLRERGGLEPAAASALWTAGLGEPDVAARLAPLADAREVDLGFYPHEGEVEVRLAARGEGAAARVARAAAQARELLGDAWLAHGRLPVTVVTSLRTQGLTLTTAESMTGGLIARMLTEVPGASDVFPGGWITYSDPWKQRALGVEAALLERYGAVSVEVARAMAEGARARAGTDLALAVTGVAGPGDAAGPAGVPVPQGTFHVALARRGGPTEVRSERLPFERAAVQRRAAVLALDLARRTLLPGPAGSGRAG